MLRCRWGEGGQLRGDRNGPLADLRPLVTALAKDIGYTYDGR